MFRRVLLPISGYKTRIAANYNQALTEIDNKLPDVAILDVKLDKGDNDGIELLSHIKSKNKDVPVIMISGHANIEMAISSLKHGAFEFVEKPFDQNRLLNFISRAVENLNLKNIRTFTYSSNPEVLTGEIEALTNYTQRKRNLELRKKIHLYMQNI